MALLHPDQTWLKHQEERKKKICPHIPGNLNGLNFFQKAHSAQRTEEIIGWGTIKDMWVSECVSVWEWVFALLGIWENKQNNNSYRKNDNI